MCLEYSCRSDGSTWWPDRTSSIRDRKGVRTPGFLRHPIFIRHSKLQEIMSLLTYGTLSGSNGFEFSSSLSGPPHAANHLSNQEPVFSCQLGVHLDPLLGATTSLRSGTREITIAWSSHPITLLFVKFDLEYSCQTASASNIAI